MILMIDNFDSFTYNIVAFYQKLGYDVLVKRNDEITLAEIEKLKCSHIIISPGPKSPSDIPFLSEVLHHFKGKKKILGICLGHQAIGDAFGGKVVKAKQVCHGKVMPMYHEKKGVFTSLSSPVFQTRYHSLVIERESLPKELEVTAWSEDGEIMGVRHREYDIEGVQFHPESFKSDGGEKILANFVESDEVSRGKLFEPQRYLKKITSRENLTLQESYEVMEEMASEKMKPEVISAFLVGLLMKGPSSDEVAGFARSILKKASPFKITNAVMDIVGTGGDNSDSFNISTLSSLVVSACGVSVAKHGNRAVSSRCGSADVLERLGVKIEVPASVMEKSLKEVGVCFLFAPLYHSSMKAVAPIRKELKLKTIFNIMGPLVNPSGVKNIMVGVYDKSLMELMADTLILLGYERVMVLHSRDGLDEVSLFDETDVIEIKNKQKKTYVISPKDFGFPSYHPSEIRGGGPEENANIAWSLLRGEMMGAKRDIVLLNSAVALYTYGKVENIVEGLKEAQKAIDEGRALAVLGQFIRITNERT